ncbi:MAG: hypothetical protein ACFFE2_03035 [Candidatus Thorarchaeota archaeon]
MSNDIATHLQALFHSGQVSSYIHSKLTNGPLKTGWIEQGLLSKGMTGKLRDKMNQETLVIPADRFARLARDREDGQEVALVIIGSKGLVSSKFVGLVYKQGNSQTLVAFQIQKTSPLEIIKLLLQFALSRKTSKAFHEPNLDYVEQLRSDVSEGSIDEMTVFALPKKQVKMSEWMKDALLSPSSESIELQHGTSNRIPKLAALLTRWLTGLELFKGTSNGIATLVFIGRKSIDACFWDQPQRIAAFMTFNHDNLDSLAMKYLNPLWIDAGESIKPPKPVREVTVEPRKSVSSIPKSSQTKSDVPSIADLTRRIDLLESSLKSSTDGTEVSGTARGTMDILQSRLVENIERIESLSNRLGDLEKRLKKLRI